MEATSIASAAVKLEQVIINDKIVYILVLAPLQSLQPTPINNEAADSSKPRSRTRTLFTPEQIGFLKDYFKTKQYPSNDDMDELGEKLNVGRNQLKFWFNNARRLAKSTGQCDGMKLRSLNLNKKKK